MVIQWKLKKLEFDFQGRGHQKREREQRVFVLSDKIIILFFFSCSFFFWLVGWFDGW